MKLFRKKLVEGSNVPPKFSNGVYWLIMALIISMAIYAYRFQFVQKPWPEGLRLKDLPLTIEEWQGVEKEFKLNYYDDESRFRKLVGTQYVMREYTNKQGNTLGLYVGYFNYMKGSENHNPDTCFTAQGWQILDRQIISFGNPPKKAISMQVAKGLKRQQVLYWFQVKDDTMVSKWKHRLYMIKQGLLQKRVSGVVVRLTAPITDKISQEEILALQKEFAGEVVKVLPEYLP